MKKNKKHRDKERNIKKEKRAMLKKKCHKKSANLIRTHKEELRVPCSLTFHYAHSQVICTVKHSYFSHALLNKATNCLSPKLTHMLGLSQMSRLNAR